jgi:hypothetical protein
LGNRFKVSSSLISGALSWTSIIARSRFINWFRGIGFLKAGLNIFTSFILVFVNMWSSRFSICLILLTILKCEENKIVLTFPTSFRVLVNSS